MITGIEVTTVEELANVGYLAKSIKATPLVQPNPSCTSYSPPPPGLPYSSQLYFSKMAPVLAKDLATFRKYFPASSLASCLPLSVFVFSRAVTVISTRGGHILGISHCCPVLCKEEGRPPDWFMAGEDIMYSMVVFMLMSWW